MSKHLWGTFGDLRYEPVTKWVRASIGEQVVVDTVRARVVWEPRRVVPSYAVPENDVAAELLSFVGVDGAQHPVQLDGVEVLDPSSPFTAHSTPGSSLTLRTPHVERAGAAFRPDDPELAGYVVLDWDAFTTWTEEDEVLLAHPRDPFSRIQCLRSSRRVQIAVDGVTLADSSAPTLLFETHLPTRYYLPPDDAVMDLLEPSDSHTVCAYKGEASYYSVQVNGTTLPDIAWTYPEPQHDAAPVRDLICFYNERLDVTVNGELQARPRTPWS